MFRVNLAQHHISYCNGDARKQRQDGVNGARDRSCGEGRRFSLFIFIQFLEAETPKERNLLVHFPKSD